jgi:hypothetical protein
MDDFVFGYHVRMCTTLLWWPVPGYDDQCTCAEPLLWWPVPGYMMTSTHVHNLVMMTSTWLWWPVRMCRTLLWWPVHGYDYQCACAEPLLWWPVPGYDDQCACAEPFYDDQYMVMLASAHVQNLFYKDQYLLMMTSSIWLLWPKYLYNVTVVYMCEATGGQCWPCVGIYSIYSTHMCAP